MIEFSLSIFPIHIFYQKNLEFFLSKNCFYIIIYIYMFHTFYKIDPRFYLMFRLQIIIAKFLMLY